MTAAMELTRWEPAQFKRGIDEVLAVYGAAMGYAPAVTQLRREHMASHAHLFDFRATVVSVGGTVCGFGYGYRSAPDQWWHQTVARGLSPEHYHAWFGDSFELAELHVLPTAQGHGIGAAILADIHNEPTWRHTLLSTPEVAGEASRAWRLYRRFGFRDVLRNFYFPGDRRAFAILGLAT